MKIRSDWKWIAKDENGEIYLYSFKPEILADNRWIISKTDGSYLRVTSIFDLQDLIELPWRDSLHQIIDGELVKFHDLKVDDKILVRDNEYQEWKKRHFSHFLASGNIAAFNEGTTSFTSDSWCDWKEWRRPENE